MNKRNFLYGIFCAAAMTSSSLLADTQKENNFNNLSDVVAGKEYRPSHDNKMKLVFFMTPQKVPEFPDCGEVFADLVYMFTDENLQHKKILDDLEVIMIMPKFKHQSQGSNDAYMFKSAYNLRSFVRILTHDDLEIIQQITKSVAGEAFPVNAEGKVTKHTRNSFLLDPNGNEVLRLEGFDIDEYFTKIACYVDAHKNIFKPNVACHDIFVPKQLH